MEERRLLHFDATAARSWLWQGGRLSHEAEFTLDAAGVEAFTAHLATRKDSHYAIVADLAEEGYQVDTLPWVHGKSRKAIIERKLAKAFFGQPLGASLSLGREKSDKGRTDEKVLLLSLAHSDYFAPWINALNQANATLAGIHSTALIQAELVAHHLPGDTGQALRAMMLVSLGQGGIRLSYFEGGKLRFSRLASLPQPPAADPSHPQQATVGTPAADSLATAIAEEASRLSNYLRGQRLVARGESLPCLVPCHADDRARFAEHCQDSGDINFRLLDINTLATSTKFASPLTDSLADPLWLHLAVKHPPGVQFATAQERHLHHLWMLRRWQAGASAAIMGICLLLAAEIYVEALFASQKTASLRAHTHALTQSYHARLAALPALATLPENLRTLASGHRELLQHSPPLGESLLAISRTLDSHPGVRLEKLEWSIGSTKDGGPTPQASPTEPPQLFITIEATLPSGMGLREQLDVAEAFRVALAKDTASKVEFLERPLNIEPGKYLKGGGREQETTEAPRFSLLASHPL